MRTAKTRAYPLWGMLVPLLAVACDPGGCEPAGGYEPSLVPACSLPNQVVSTDASGQLICKPLPPGISIVPSCRKYSQALTADGQRLLCAQRNNEAQDLRDALDRLEDSELLLRELTTKLVALPAPSMLRQNFCGLYSAAQNPNGAITDSATGGTGIAAAASLCRKVTGCSPTTAKRCTVYDLYYSAALGRLAGPLPPAWVFMASWQHNNAAQVPTASGLADNCSGYTYGLDDKLWYGTAIAWQDAPSGHKALQVASGPGVVACSARFPIACCN